MERYNKNNSNNQAMERYNSNNSRSVAERCYPKAPTYHSVETTRTTQFKNQTRTTHTNVQVMRDMVSTGSGNNRCSQYREVRVTEKTVTRTPNNGNGRNNGNNTNNNYIQYYWSVCKADKCYVCHGSAVCGYTVLFKFIKKKLIVNGKKFQILLAFSNFYVWM